MAIWLCPGPRSATVKPGNVAGEIDEVVGARIADLVLALQYGERHVLQIRHALLPVTMTSWIAPWSTCCALATKAALRSRQRGG